MRTGKHYPIELPILAITNALHKAKMAEEKQELQNLQLRFILIGNELY